MGDELTVEFIGLCYSCSNLPPKGHLGSLNITQQLIQTCAHSGRSVTLLREPIPPNAVLLILTTVDSVEVKSLFKPILATPPNLTADRCSVRFTVGMIGPSPAVPVPNTRQETLEQSYPVTPRSQYERKKGSGYHLVPWQQGPTKPPGELQKVEPIVTIRNASRNAAFS